MRCSGLALFCPLALGVFPFSGSCWSVLCSFCSVGWVGGAGGCSPFSNVLALIMHTQLRSCQSLPTYWSLDDLRWAFDVADIPGMKLQLFNAGVCGTEWLIIDDIMDMDRQCIHLHGFLSAVFMLACGTGQGRRYSVHAFNALLLPCFATSGSAAFLNTALRSSVFCCEHASRPATVGRWTAAAAVVTCVKPGRGGVIGAAVVGRSQVVSLVYELM